MASIFSRTSQGLWDAPKSGGVTQLPSIRSNMGPDSITPNTTPQTDDPYMDDLIQQFLGSNPNAAFFSAFPKAGGTGNLSEFIRGSQGRLFNSYLADLPNNPNMLFQDFIKGQDLESQFKGLSPRARGENPSMFAPNVRFLSRRF